LKTINGWLQFASAGGDKSQTLYLGMPPPSVACGTARTVA